MKVKRFVTLALLAVMALSVLTGCARVAKPVPEGMDEESAGEAGRQIMELLVKEDYQAVADAFRADMKEQYSVDADAVRTIVGDTFEKAGAFEEITKTLAVGGEVKGFDEPYAAVVVSAKHENKRVFYEFSFDTDLQLLGLGLRVSKR